ncbi:hypothetical protein AYO20_07890 [Fonsecaea nubica]|uniref:Xylanolytic transcriptional activator regulatory domain-containing protein n=1 Tax=Fonsecaea nubica TaxID=856822 RepID=A0A178CRU6_9EURO|nr:hypothetical protein AYO20_07890 [Fonsecaea nubica]OAL32580.1 hypothetical protein AYO20_07890 [Fonsecaea nubica]
MASKPAEYASVSIQASDYVLSDRHRRGRVQRVPTDKSASTGETSDLMEISAPTSGISKNATVDELRKVSEQSYQTIQPPRPSTGTDTSPSEVPGSNVETSDGTSLPGAATPAQECDEGYNGAAYTDAMNNRRAQSALPLYLGEPHVLSFVMDVCQSEHQHHYLVPRAAARALPPDDLAFLKAKGCFSLPVSSVSNKLLQHYFHYVHPFLPVVDAHTILTQYHQKSAQQVHLLLLWSMLFAAASFADPELVREAGYPSRKAMKHDLYQRAKSLYNFEYETDKTILIQSTILLAYWFNDSEDRTGNWYWIGIAISLCHSIGIHQDTQNPSSRTSSLPQTQHVLWRLIWWSCYFRETWISFGMGRPMRIHLQDCNVPMPSVDDIMLLCGRNDTPQTRFYLPNGTRALARCWLKILHLSATLDCIHLTHYKPNRAKASTSEILNDRERVLKCSQMSLEGVADDEDPVVQLVSYQVQVIEHSVYIALYRPYLFASPSDLTPDQFKVWRPTILNKIYTAASAVTMILTNLSQAGLVDRAHSILVTAIVPAMQMHLYGSVSSQGLGKQMSAYQLEVCMTIMAEMGKTFWHASMTHKIFCEAVRKLKDKASSSGTVRQHGGPMSSSMQDQEPSTSVSVEDVFSERRNQSTDPSDTEIISLFTEDFLFPPDDGMSSMAFQESVCQYEPGWDFETNTFMGSPDILNFADPGDGENVGPRRID